MDAMIDTEKGRILLEESESLRQFDRRWTRAWTIAFWALAVIMPVVHLASHPWSLAHLVAAAFLFLFPFVLGILGFPTALINRPVRMHEKGVDNLGYLKRQFVPFESMWYAVVDRQNSYAVIWFYFKRKYLGMTWGGFYAEGGEGFMDELREIIGFLNSKGVKAGFKPEMDAIGVKIRG